MPCYSWCARPAEVQNYFNPGHSTRIWREPNAIFIGQGSGGAFFLSQAKVQLRKIKITLKSICFSIFLTLIEVLIVFNMSTRSLNVKFCPPQYGVHSMSNESPVLPGDVNFCSPSRSAGEFMKVLD